MSELNEALTTCQPICCERCSRWLDLRHYPSNWNAYWNICGDCEPPLPVPATAPTSKKQQEDEDYW